MPEQHSALSGRPELRHGDRAVGQLDREDPPPVRVGLVVICRHVNPDYSTGEQASGERLAELPEVFNWATCCVHVVDWTASNLSLAHALVR